MNKIVNKEHFSANVVKLEVEAPLIARSRKAGHFVIVREGEKGERIPLTIAGADTEKGTITLVIQAVGDSSRKICALNVGDYLDFVRKQELINGGMNEQAAAQTVQMEKERAYIDAQKAQIQQYQQQQNSVLEQTRKAQEARQKDFNEFLTKYPKVDPKSIPREVWDAVRNGESLVSAYTMHENARLQAELAAERQNAKNRATAPGSMGGSDMETQADLISRYWDEAD